MSKEMEIEITKNCEVLGVEFKPGESIRVESWLANLLIERGRAVKKSKPAAAKDKEK